MRSASPVSLIASVWPGGAIDLLKPVFYRSTGAFLVGRVCGGPAIMPLVIALRHGDHGLIADAILLSEDEVSIVFSFTRSYFHVDLEYPYETVQFLRRSCCSSAWPSCMPRWANRATARPSFIVTC